LGKHWGDGARGCLGAARFWSSAQHSVCYSETYSGDVLGSALGDALGSELGSELGSALGAAHSGPGGRLAQAELDMSDGLGLLLGEAHWGRLGIALGALGLELGAALGVVLRYSVRH
jgi:hypothetical protein